jgi:FAD/FMN-containing dehydrogenase
MRTGAAAATAMAARLWRPSGAVAACDLPPPKFPSDIPLARTRFENWSQEIAADGLWTAAPRSGEDVCRLADWARAAGWVLRPKGMMHTWAPLTVRAGAYCGDRVLLIDTTAGLTRVSTAAAEVRAEAGALLDDVSQRMQAAGTGFTSVPAIGAVTIGGVLAIDGHGAALPAAGEQAPPGAGFGSLSDLVISITAAAWSPRRGRYVLETFPRTDPRCRALMVHLGRAFVTEVRLRAIPDQRLRCESLTDVPGAELFAAPGSTGRTFMSYLDAAGRVEAIWFPFTEAPWLKVWSVTPQKPASSREVSAPYNYPFSDRVPDELAAMARDIVTGDPELTPMFGRTMYNAAVAGLAVTDSSDIWGWSKDVQYYIRATTLRVAEFGYGVLCARADVQSVLHTVTSEYTRRLETEAAAGRYPVNMPLDVRVSGIDDGRAVGIQGARPPLLSALQPVRRRPDWDCVVWFNVLDLTGTVGAGKFKAGFEDWLRRAYGSDRGLARAEWSKGWAYGDAGPWRREGFAAVAAPYGSRRTIAARRLRSLDPHGVFRSPVTGRLFSR